ncbi:MAG: DnaD domain protein [Bacilli bacterium]|nr:DnaD domain protein [Bacilli bacterium]
MNYVGSQDFLEVISESLISNVDIDVVTRLYQPLIGHKASMLYLTLLNYVNYNEGELLIHDNLFRVMQISPGDFISARMALEAVGLMKTYLKNDDDVKNYIYILYAPKSPRDFFTDVLFKGLLVRYIGEKEATKLALHYQVNADLKDAKDVSANFVEVFQPNLDDDSFDAKMPTNLKDTKALKVDTDFSFEDFFTHLKTAMMIKEDAFSDEECSEIERIATLYGLDTITTCDIVAQSYDESKRKGSRLDFTAFKERAISQAKFSPIIRKNNENKRYIKISGKTALADEIRLMETLSPKLYLQEKQDGVPPVTADLNLLNYLNEVMGLNRSTINALISYSLKMCDNRLVRAYIEKVAATLKRAKINNALDAINFLNEKKEKPKKTYGKKKIDQPNIKKDDDSFDEAEYEKILASIDKENK